MPGWLSNDASFNRQHAAHVLTSIFVAPAAEAPSVFPLFKTKRPDFGLVPTPKKDYYTLGCSTTQDVCGSAARGFHPPATSRLGSLFRRDQQNNATDKRAVSHPRISVYRV